MPRPTIEGERFRGLLPHGNLRPSRRDFLGAALFGAIATPARAETNGIVLIFVDDLFSIEHYRYTFGVPIHTPNFDALMARGTTFMNAFASTALCCPSRTSILTGMNPFKTRVF